VTGVLAVLWPTRFQLVHSLVERVDHVVDDPEGVPAIGTIGRHVGGENGLLEEDILLADRADR
jgi:hypothetical protein